MRSIVSLFLMLTTMSMFPVSQSLTWFILEQFSRRGKLQTFEEFPPVTTQKAICYAKFWKAICSLCPLVGLLIGSQAGLASETCLNIIFQFYRFNNVNAIHRVAVTYWLIKIHSQWENVYFYSIKQNMDFATGLKNVCGGGYNIVYFLATRQTNNILVLHFTSTQSLSLTYTIRPRVVKRFCTVSQPRTTHHTTTTRFFNR